MTSSSLENISGEKSFLNGGKTWLVTIKFLSVLKIDGFNAAQSQPSSIAIGFPDSVPFIECKREKEWVHSNLCMELC